METVLQRFSDLDTLLDHIHTQCDAWTPTEVHAPRAQTDALHWTRLALHEWVANLMRHAEFDNRAPELLLCLCPNEQRVRGVLEDNSRGFDLEANLTVQEAMVEAYPERGMGLLILQACTDNLAYQRTENGRYRLEFSIPMNQDPCLSLPFEEEEQRALSDHLDDPGRKWVWSPVQNKHKMADLNLMQDHPPILLVEDNPAHADLIMRSFDEHAIPGHVHHVTDGESALSYLYREGIYADPERSPRPRMILLDLNLPKMSGLDVLQAIKTTDHLKSIPVVIMTTSDSEQDTRLAYERYANSYVVKPMDFTAFIALMELLGMYWLRWNHNL